MNALKCFLFIQIILIYTSNNFAQKPPMKYGKVSEANLKINKCPIDSNAHAYYIFDYGESNFELKSTTVRENDASNDNGFHMMYKRHFRIKILDNQSFELANIEIPLYHDNDEEQIVSLKATTYNLNGGKIEKSKLTVKDLMTEETSKNWYTKKLVMPNVREGSIIEVEYKVSSDFFFNLHEWYFQRSIPVLSSEYHVKIPEYFQYNQTQYGYFPFQRETSARTKTVSITYAGSFSQSGNSRNAPHTSELRYKENIYDYYSSNVIAFPFEDYLKTAQNYLSKIGFELASTKFPNSGIYYYTNTWDQVNTKLMENYSFGKELNKTAHIKKDVELLSNLEVEGLDLMNAAFDHVKKKMAWNGIRNKYVTTSLGKAYHDNGGNCGDINLNLVIFLRDLGFDANPLVLSTTDNGIVHPAHPSLSVFNYVIAHVSYEDKDYLMDATDPYSGINLLPVRCLNDKGKIISETKSDWVNLMDYKPYTYISSYEIQFDRDFKLEGKRNLILKDYAAYSYDSKIRKFNNLDEFARDIEKSDPNLHIKDIDLIRDSLTNNLNLNYTTSIDASVNAGADIIYFSPCVQTYFDENPFKLVKREYPVEFSFPYIIQQNFMVNLPEGYVISELPESVLVDMPGEVGKYCYQISSEGNKVKISSLLIIGRSLYLPDEYESLKSLFQTMIDKQNELIVIKKV